MYYYSTCSHHGTFLLWLPFVARRATVRLFLVALVFMALKLAFPVRIALRAHFGASNGLLEHLVLS